jgi:sugar/nucleoside kinase (ribokinase family)
MNRAEAPRLADLEDGGPGELAATLLAMGLSSGVMTGGAGPVTGFDADGVFSIDPPEARQVADVTGAGDALAGGTVAALLRGAPLRRALREGMAAALLTVESPHAVAWTTEAERSAALALVPEAVAVA